MSNGVMMAIVTPRRGSLFVTRDCLNVELLRQYPTLTNIQLYCLPVSAVLGQSGSFRRTREAAGDHDGALAPDRREEQGDQFPVNAAKQAA